MEVVEISLFYLKKIIIILSAEGNLKSSYTKMNIFNNTLNN